MNANQLNLIDTAWTTGYVIGQLPSQFILTKVRPSIWIPSCELVWTLLTFSLAVATTSNQVIGLRFFVGLCESIFYPAAHFLIGSWYKPSELGKRACIFHASSALAGMFSGYLQSAVHTGLNGTLGKAGWQWLFVSKRSLVHGFPEKSVTSCVLNSALIVSRSWTVSSACRSASPASS